MSKEHLVFGIAFLMTLAIPNLSRAQDAESTAVAAPPAEVPPEAKPGDQPTPSPTPLPVPTPAALPPPSAAAPSPSGQESSKRILFSAGMGTRSTHWNHIEDSSNTNAKYDVADAQHVMVEGDLSIPRISVKLGFNVQQGGGISDFSQLMGYLGFKNMTVKSERGKFAGRASHNAPPVPARSVSFDQAYQYTECDIGVPFDPTAYVGLRYTTWKLPAEIALLAPEKTSGPTVFDENFQAEFYSLIMGMDLFKRDLLFAPESFMPGWGVMFTFNTGIGLGKSKISDQVAKDVKTYYSNKTLTEQSPGVFTVHIEGQLGPRYQFDLYGLRGVLGVGYDMNLLMLINSGRQATSSTELQPVAYPNFTYQGWVARLHTVF